MNINGGENIEGGEEEKRRNAQIKPRRREEDLAFTSANKGNKSCCSSLVCSPLIKR